MVARAPLREAARRRFGAFVGSRSKGGGDSAGPQEVDLDGVVEGRVETDGCGRVHGDVDRAQHPLPFIVETEAIGTDIAGDRGDPAGAHRGEVFARESTGGDGVGFECGAKPVEGVVAEDVPIDPVLCAATPGAHDQHQFAIGDGAEESFDECRAEKAGGARDRDPLAAEFLANHAPFLAHFSTNW